MSAPERIWLRADLTRSMKDGLPREMAEALRTLHNWREAVATLAPELGGLISAMDRAAPLLARWDEMDA